MLRIVIYGPDVLENRRVRELLEDLIWSMQIKPVFREFSEEREPFFTYVKNNPYLVMLIVQSGPEGAETARLAKAGNPKTRIIWFSEQDYALYAFELNLTFFGLLPVNRSKVETALDICCTSRHYPPWNDTLSLSQTTLYNKPHIQLV